MRAQVCVPDAGEAVLDGTIGVAQNADSILYGGHGTVLIDDPTELSVQVIDTCLLPLGGTDYCNPQATSATIVIQGPIEDWPLQMVDGEVGYAVDSVTGDPICGSDEAAPLSNLPPW